MSGHGAHALSGQQALALNQVMQLLGAGRVAEATAVAGALAQQAGQSPDAHQALAICHARAGRTAEADAAFDRAVRLAPDHPGLLCNSAVVLRKLGRFDESAARLRRATELQPTSAQAWSELGTTWLAAGRAGRAIGALRRATALQPRGVLAWHLLGNACSREGELEDAEQAFRRTVEIDPAQRTAWINLADVLRRAGRPEAAVSCLEQAAAHGHAGVELADAMAGAVLDTGDPARATALAEQAIRAYPQSPRPYVTLANLLTEYGSGSPSTTDPLARLRDAVDRQPAEHGLRLSLARMLVTTGDAGAALGHVDRLRGHVPDPVLSCLEADALDRVGEADRAGALYARLCEPGAEAPADVLDAYARHLLCRGDPAKAARIAEAATILDPTDQTAWAYLATAWRLLGDRREDWLCDWDRLIGQVDVEVPSGHADRATFLGALNDVLGTLHLANHEPMQQSLRGGSQTPGFLFGRSQPVLRETREAILSAVSTWAATLPKDPSHPFLRRATGAVRLAGSWSVKLWSSGSHVNHIHPAGWMSSAFYVSLPPSVEAADGSPGFLQFGQPPVELGLDLPPRRVVRPVAGRLVLFPSYVWHGTVPFEDSQPRVTIAFDALPASDR